MARCFAPHGSREQTMRPEMPWMAALHGQTVDGKDITLLEATLRHHQDYLFGGHDNLPPARCGMRRPSSLAHTSTAKKT